MSINIAKIYSIDVYKRQVMGCPVNGPGEARHADFGIAGAIKEGYIFKKGEIIARVPEADLINSLENIIMESYSSVK